MAIDVTLRDIQSGHLTATAFTENNTLIEQALAKAIDRNGGANNEMLADLDMGLNNIINVNDIDVNSVTIDGADYAVSLQAIADDAQASADASSTSAGESALSASDAADSLALVQTLSDQFRGTYYGEAASDPALDPLGNPITPGDLYYNTTDNKLYVYNGDTEAWAPVEDSFTVDADQVAYDNTVSGLSATNAQAAIDENVEAINQRVIYVGSVAELPSATLIDGAQYQTAEFWDGEGVGMNTYVWVSAQDKTTHNGISIVDPDKISELTAPGTFGTYFTAAGSGTGCFVTTTSDFNLHVTHAGAVKDTESYPAINAYALYMTDRQLEASFTGGPYLFSSTVDLTASSQRIAKLRGDTEDANNVGVYNLQYTGAGTAIIADELILTRLGLAGTAGVTDAIPSGTVALQTNESWILIQSYIRNFGTLVDVNGGFYSKVYGGRYQRAVTLFNYNTPIYNVSFDGQFNDFEIGVSAGGGNGPVALKGAWEKFTRGVLVAKNASDQFGCYVDNIYVENQPGQAIAAGLTGPSANYESDVGFYVANGSFKGTGTIFVDGIAGSVVEAGNTETIDTNIEWFDGGDASRPTYLYEALSCKNLSALGAFRQNDFSGISEVSPELDSAFSTAGVYATFDGKIQSPETERQDANLLNGWTTGSGVFVTAAQGSISIRGDLIAGGSTSTTFLTLTANIRPRREVRAVVQTNVAGTNYIAVLRVGPGGNCIIENMDGTAFTAGIVQVSADFEI